LQNQFTNRKADLEAEALPEALTFCWKRKRRKRKRLGWKQSGSAKNLTASASLAVTLSFRCSLSPHAPGVDGRSRQKQKQRKNNEIFI
jgi:hypothetical protein